MREILFKNLISEDKTRTELFMSEHFEEGGVILEFEKKTVYTVKEVLEFVDAADLELFLNQREDEDSPSQIFFIKMHNTKTNRTKFIYKIIGDQYVVLDDKIFILKVSHYKQRIMRHKATKTEKI